MKNIYIQCDIVREVVVDIHPGGEERRRVIIIVYRGAKCRWFIGEATELYGVGVSKGIV